MHGGGHANHHDNKQRTFQKLHKTEPSTVFTNKKVSAVMHHKMSKMQAAADPCLGVLSVYNQPGQADSINSLADISFCA